MTYIKCKATVFVLLCLASTSLSYGAEIEDVTFDDRVMVDGTRLSLRGTGLLRHLGFIKAYVGALYVEEDQLAQDPLDNIAKRLEVEYFWAIGGEDFGKAIDKVIPRNVDSTVLGDIKARIEKHKAMYRDVQIGDRYSLTYIPEKDTELALNGRSLGVIEGSDFAHALFAMWLGAKPMNMSFKQQLLDPK